MEILSGKIALVTGGSRGIGYACCLAFARAGADVAFTYNKSSAQAEKLCAEIQTLGRRALALQADVKDYPACRRAAEEALAKFGKIDILVNNAGVTRDKALFLMSEEDWQEVIQINLCGTINMSRALITPMMKQKSGCIINMSSVSGAIGLARQTNYSASKAGIIGFTKALAKEVGRQNIRVNAVCPGFIETDMVAGLSEKLKSEILKYIPQQRLGSADEVAQLCVFLASEEAGYITGQAVKIDGGMAI